MYTTISAALARHCRMLDLAKGSAPYARAFWQFTDARVLGGLRRLLFSEARQAMVWNHRKTPQLPFFKDAIAQELEELGALAPDYIARITRVHQEGFVLKHVGHSAGHPA